MITMTTMMMMIVSNNVPTTAPLIMAATLSVSSSFPLDGTTVAIVTKLKYCVCYTHCIIDSLNLCEESTVF